MTLLQQFTEYVTKKNLFQKTDHLLLAVSGGVDSVVLCFLCKEAGYLFSIAHCNFNLRGNESKRDEEFVKGLSERLEVPLFVKIFDTKSYAAENKCSIQVAARELRYNWFYELLKGEENTNVQYSGFNAHSSTHQLLKYIVTAHHLDDNIETLLMNFFKGTGATGLRAIEPKRNKIVRPLLWASKEALMAYAQEKGISWVHDSSNDKIEYTRNFFRQTLLPQIESVFPAVKQNLAQNIVRFSEVEVLYKQAIEEHKKKLLQFRGKEVFIAVLKLSKAIPLHTIVFEISKEFGFSALQVPQITKLLISESGKYITSATHRILRNRAWLIISPLNRNDQQIIVIEKQDREITFDNSILSIHNIKKEDIQLSTKKEMAFLNADAITFPLLLRHWKEGDYFYPLGMTKKKKLARFFIDEKLSKKDKEEVWVLEMNKKIIWVINHRIDNRFRVSDTTKEVLQLLIKPQESRAQKPQNS